jgi:hypothetical protein
MKRHPADLRSLALCAVLGAVATLSGCGSKEPPPQAQAPTPVAAPDAVPAAATATPVTAAEVTRTWTPEALEELLAPIALYPDPVLSQLLIAATNPQEVLDAGNWLLQNTTLKGSALDDAAATVGFTPPIRALVQFPETVDMMCLELDWTTELGEAFVADQAGVLGAVQRLRKQAVDVGNLQSSEQMKVETQVQEGQEVVVLKPAKPEVVYVPQYDPVAAYAPAPATTTPATTVTEEKSGHSTGAMITTGVLAFGAGILVNELFDDDHKNKNKNKYDYYYPNYGYGGMPYYPPYPYRPSYGGGHYPSSGYNRPPGYNSGFNNSGNIVINTGGNRPGNNYWDRYDRKPGADGYNRPRPTSSPISAARPNRPELNDLNKRQPRAMPADVKRPSPNATAANWKGQGGYAGAKPGSNRDAKDRIANAQPGYSNPAKARPATRDVPKTKAPPKVQGSYAGARAIVPSQPRRLAICRSHRRGTCRSRRRGTCSARRRALGTFRSRTRAPAIAGTQSRCRAPSLLRDRRKRTDPPPRSPCRPSGLHPRGATVARRCRARRAATRTWPPASAASRACRRVPEARAPAAVAVAARRSRRAERR